MTSAPWTRISQNVFYWLGHFFAWTLEFKHQVIIAIRGVISIINFGLFVAGSIWVFTTPRHCNEVLFYFIYVVLMVQYIILSLGCLILSCIGCCWVCFICLRWKDKRQQSNSTGRTDEESEGGLQIAPPPNKHRAQQKPNALGEGAPSALAHRPTTANTRQ